MKMINLTIAASVLAISSSASANSLQPRLGGLAFYDDVAGLTWLADANYAQTSSYAGALSDGRMTWQAANDWAASLTVDGVSGWRLADTLQPDTSCGFQSGSVSYGYNCTGSEMGNLFYNVLGNVAYSLTNTGPFTNVQSFYFSATEQSPNGNGAWGFDMSNGVQIGSYKFDDRYAWAVQSGDVSPVPVPAAVWLLGSGLIGLVGFAKRKKT